MNRLLIETEHLPQIDAIAFYGRAMALAERMADEDKTHNWVMARFLTTDNNRMLCMEVADTPLMREFKAVVEKCKSRN